MINIRKAVAKDFEEYFKLEEEYCKYNNKIAHSLVDIYFLNKKEFYKKFLKKLRSKNLFLVLDDGKHLQGFFQGVIDKRYGIGYNFKNPYVGYVGNVFISKKFRGKGYFSEFMKQFIEFLKKKKIKYMVLHVDINNKNAIKSYKRFGFKITEYKMVTRLK